MIIEILTKYNNSLEYYAKSNDKEYLLREFSSKNENLPQDISYGSSKNYWWECSDCGSDYDMSVRSRTLSNGNCPYCAGRRVNQTNSLSTTHPDIAVLLVNKSLAHNVTYGSSRKADFICNRCGHVLKDRIISNITKRGFHCPICSDYITYPEKFIFALLEQFDVDFEYQKTFKWSQGKRYDFYIPSLEVIIEAHGGQHYKEPKGCWNSLEEVQENDRLKENLAKENGIHSYIIIDCRKSEREWISNNIINGELSDLLDLPNADWLKCSELATDSIIWHACDLWNNKTKNIKEISKIMKINRSTVVEYLKAGSDLNWCDYTITESLNNHYSNMRRRIVQLDLRGGFIKEWESMKEAQKNTGIHVGSISGACKGKNKSAGGYRWMYKEDYEKNKNSILKYTSINNQKTIVKLDLDGNFINSYESMKKAALDVGVKSPSISAVCRGLGKTAGGYKWMYLEDYEKLDK